MKKRCVVTDDIVTRSQQHGTYHDNTGTDAEYIQHLELKLDKAADEIERLRADMKELLQITKLFADEGKCFMYEDQLGFCTHSPCDWHDAEHMWESFCMSRGI